MFVTGPNVVKTVTNEDVTQEELGGAGTHTSKSGVAHGAFDNDIEALAQVREFFNFLPLSAKDKDGGPVLPNDDPIDRKCDSLDNVVPTDPNVPYDMKVRRGRGREGEGKGRGACGSFSVASRHTSHRPFPHLPIPPSIPCADRGPRDPGLERLLRAAA
jgi:hypothetical protein